MYGKKMTDKTKQGHTRLFQFRLRIDLFQALVAEVERRHALGHDASLNAVGQEWMERGRDHTPITGERDSCGA